jgi:DNA-3-methyladenine glycosylase I
MERLDLFDHRPLAGVENTVRAPQHTESPAVDGDFRVDRDLGDVAGQLNGALALDDAVKLGTHRKAGQTFPGSPDRELQHRWEEVMDRANERSGFEVDACCHGGQHTWLGRYPVAMIERCPWPAQDPLYIEYHDTEWGVPVHDDRRQFEFLILEGAQAGLSWRTILQRRDGYRRAFAGFDPQAVARFDEHDVARLLADPGIIRNRLKVHAAINNARRFLAVQEEFGSFDSFIWSFVGSHPLVNAWSEMGQIPAKTPEAEALSKALVKRGFKFVGPTIVYAHMQACGLVNDHVMSCFRHRELARLK